MDAGDMQSCAMVFFQWFIARGHAEVVKSEILLGVEKLDLMCI